MKISILVVGLLVSGGRCFAQAVAESDETDVPAFAMTGEAIDSATAEASLPATRTPEAATQTAPQPTDDFCFHARPAPACRFFAVTDFGWLVGLTRTGAQPVWASSPGSPVRAQRVLTDLGVMWNMGRRDAIGVAGFFTASGGAYGEDGFAMGATARYRRWLNDRLSLDLAVGTQMTDGFGTISSRVTARGSILGLVKYSPVPWFGVAVRPEILHVRTRDCYPQLSPLPCAEGSVSSPRVLVGIEFNESPGAVMSGIFDGAVGLVYLLLFLFGGG